jgi:hypothetical protein
MNIYRLNPYNCKNTIATNLSVLTEHLPIIIIPSVAFYLARSRIYDIWGKLYVGGDRIQVLWGDIPYIIPDQIFLGAGPYTIEMVYGQRMPNANMYINGYRV